MVNRANPQIPLMCTFLAPKTVPLLQQTTESATALSQTTTLSKSSAEPKESFAEQVLFWSDMPSSSSEDEIGSSNEDRGNHHPPDLLPRVPPCKRQKLDVPFRVQRQQRRKQKIDDLKKAHVEIKKLLASQKTQFVAGQNGLQIW
jgi:hypothetical protein